MDPIDIDILKYLSKRENYNALKDTITKSLCVKEAWRMLADYGAFFDAHPSENAITSDFILWQRLQRHPHWKPEEARVQGAIVQNILDHPEPQRTAFLDNINHLRTQGAYQGIADAMAAGTMGSNDAEDAARKLIRTDSTANVMTSYTLDDIATLQGKGGYYWRLEDLNKSLGPLRKGDFIIVGKRPEVGGTSFLVSELSFMLEQTDGNAIIFNNEEAPNKVYSRMVSSALGVDHRKLLGDTGLYQTQYNAWLGTSRWDLVHDTNMDIGSLHRALEDRDYDLIGINVLLKVKGTGAKEDHDKFQALGEECRRISQKYGPVIAIVQADPSAEGMQYIPQDRIYKSKTALQGEADGLIMIGTDELIKDTVRYIHVAKNKLPPAMCTDTRLKHIRSEVKFDFDTGRFTSANYKKNSRPGKRKTK